MRRREFITLAGSAAAAWPLAARGQQPDRMRRIAILSSGGTTNGALTTFRQALDRLGWHEAQNVIVEVREAESDSDLARGYAAELVAVAPDVWFATNTQMVQLIKDKTDSIPIVFVQVPDPVGSGFAVSFARPGGNVTGFTNFDSTMGEKWLELLKDVVPDLKRVAVILQAENPTAAGYLQRIEAAAAKFVVQVSPASLRDGTEIGATILASAKRRAVVPVHVVGLLILAVAFDLSHFVENVRWRLRNAIENREHCCAIDRTDVEMHAFCLAQVFRISIRGQECGLKRLSAVGRDSRRGDERARQKVRHFRDFDQSAGTVVGCQLTCGRRVGIVGMPGLPRELQQCAHVAIALQPVWLG
jgi:hypothetical protein